MYQTNISSAINEKFIIPLITLHKLRYDETSIKLFKSFKIFE